MSSVHTAGHDSNGPRDSIVPETKQHVLDLWSTEELDFALPVLDAAPNTRRYPHLVLQGRTGSGKSVFLQALIYELSYRNSPETVNFLLIDSKGSDPFTDLKDLPHVGAYVDVSRSDLRDRNYARLADALVFEIKRRRRLLHVSGVGDIDLARAAGVKLPYLFIVVDGGILDYSFSSSLIRAVDTLIVEGDSLGMYLVVANQTLDRAEERVARQALRLSLSTGSSSSVKMHGDVRATDLVQGEILIDAGGEFTQSRVVTVPRHLEDLLTPIKEAGTQTGLSAARMSTGYL